MLSFDEALKAILEAVPVPGAETVSIRKALGRVLAENLTVPRDFPDTRRSAVDGYAIRIGDGSEFKQVGVVAAGGLPDFTLGPGQCAAVMTGGTVPGGADCVAMVEDCEEKNGIVKVKASLEPGGLINEPGVEARAGAPLARPGQRINRAVYPVLFYAGIAKVDVYRTPRIGILMTGDELREVEAGPAKGQVFNTNRYIVESFLDSVGLGCEFEARVPDEEKATRRAIEEMAEKCDFIVSSGGVSMGRFDYIKKIFHDSDLSLLVDKTAIKPGRPLMVAERRGKLFFGMPGYPAAFLTNAILYLVPALKKACGRTDFEHRPLDAELITPMPSRKGRLYLNRAILELAHGKWTARDPGAQKSSHFLNFAEVNGLALLPPSVGDVDTGAMVEALHFGLELC
jgi:molybdopterin molybdotransferase